MKAGGMALDNFKVRSDLHVARKLWHGLAVIFIVVCYHNLSRRDGLLVLSAATAAFILVDLLRQRFDWLNKAMVAVFGPVMRKHEINNLAGTTYLLAGVLLVTLIFDRSVVKLTLFFLAVGDPVASYFGLRFGKDRLIGNKTLQGSIAAFIACTLIAVVYYTSGGLMRDHLLVVSLLSGLIGALSELLPIGKLDDNFTFPLICSFSLYGLFHLFGAYA